MQSGSMPQETYTSPDKVLGVALLTILLQSSTRRPGTRSGNSYDGPGHGNDEAYGLAVDSHGNVIVAGHSFVSLEASSDFTVVKYSSTGAPFWTRRYNGPGSGIDMAFFAAVDSSDNVYASGFSVGKDTTAEDFVTIKYAP